MRESGTIEAIARVLGEALQPLATRLAPANVDEFFASLGVGVPPGFTSQPPLAASLNAVAAGAGGLAAPLAALGSALGSGNAAQIAGQGLTVLQDLKLLLQGLPQIGTGIQQVALTFPDLEPAQRTALGNLGGDFAAALVPRLLVDWLETQSANLVPALGLTGLVDDLPDPGDPFDAFKPAFRRRALRFDLIGDWLSHPELFLQNAFGLGRPDFDGLQIFERLKNYLEQADLGAAIISAPGIPNMLDAFVFRLAVDPTTAPPSLGFVLRLAGQKDISVTTSINPTWTLRFATTGRWDRGLEGRVDTDLSAELHPIPGSSGTASLGFHIGLQADRGPDGFTLLGQPGATRVGIRRFAVAFGIDAAWNGTDAVGAPAITVTLDEGKAVIDTSHGDSFLHFLTGGIRGEGSFSLSGAWTPKGGLRFDGSSGLEVALPMHAAIGPARLDRLYLRAGLDSDGSIPVEISAAIASSLGPLAVSVDRLGVIARARFPKTGGNLGPLDIGFEFKPPNGVGLELDGGGFKGGGFLYRDADRGEYGGTLELEFQGLVTVKGIGLLNTRMPDGSGGFSLLIIISAEFIPIQLGFGFTLIGVGGLLGLNRTVLLDPLRAGVRDGSIESVLFPKDVVGNAARVLGDLRRIFPPQDGRFLIGPMAKLGWGTPTLMSVELGIILEIPRPAFAVPGVLRVAIPAEDVPLIQLQANFLGVIDFQTSQLSFDASLFDSHLLALTLSGDMALRLYWGADANFLLTVGGFHPAYTPPPMGLGPLERLSIDMFVGMPRIRAEAYFAVTSNTVQFGARVELYAGVDIFYVYGFMALDVLIQFNPVHFIAQMSAMLAVKSGSDTLLGVRVDAQLEGPSAWHAHGTGTFEIGFIVKVSFDVDFDVTVGDERKTTLPPIPVLPLLREALDNKGNWRAVFPANSRQSVSLREVPDTSDALILHPFGTLEVSQKRVPLNLPIARFGAQQCADGPRYRISKLAFGTEVVVTEPAREQFAPAQFLDMSDAEKLSRRSFERYDAGVRAGGGDRANADYHAGFDVVYEVIYLPAKRKGWRFRLSAFLMKSLLKVGAAAQSSLSFENRSPSALAAPRAETAAEQFAVTNKNDLSLHSHTMVFDSEAEAHAAMRDTLARSPDLARELQVVPLYEVAHS